MANEGLLLQLDGSHHKWNGQDEWCLIGMIDDATSRIAHAEFFKSEDTLSCMAVLKKVIEKFGVPVALYVDRAGWFGGTKRQDFSQFTRACDELGIRVIYANSPEGKGRIERAWRTFQDRLIPELRFEGITAMSKANAYLQESFLPDYWEKRNIVAAPSPESAYRTLSKHCALEEILCSKYSRTVTRGETFQFCNETFVIINRNRHSLAGREIMIHCYPDGHWRAYAGKVELAIRRMVRSRCRTHPIHDEQTLLSQDDLILKAC